MVETMPFCSWVDSYWNISKLSGDSSASIEESEEDRRSGFVDSLLNANGSSETTSVGDIYYKGPENFDEPVKNENAMQDSVEPRNQSKFIHFLYFQFNMQQFWKGWKYILDLNLYMFSDSDQA